jgi:RNA polymerase sigma-70 factor (ECF subfamily)
MAEDDEIRERLARALAGDRAAVRSLVSALRPVVQAEVAAVLLRCATASGRDARQEVDDLVQDVFAALWANGGRLLLRWDPARGRTLESWARLVARSRALDVLRSRVRTPWGDDSREPSALDAASPGSDDLDRRMTERDALTQLQTRLHAQLDERGWRLFLALFVEERPVAQVAAEVEMTAAAIYQWKSRLVRQLVATEAEAEAEVQA